MNKILNNYAFIDGQNLNLSIQELGWKLDYRKFRIYLKEKYHIERAYYFIGFVEGNNDLYSFLQKAGYVLIFKPTIQDKDGNIKGNVDADLVLQAMIDYSRYAQALIISSDGDFYSLVKYLRENNKLLRVLVPNFYKYSALLKKFSGGNIAFLNQLKDKLEYIKKAPHKDKP